MKLLLASGMLGIAVLARAAEPEPVPFSHLEVRLGAFLVSGIGTDFRLDTDLRHGTDIDFTDLLGGENSLDVFRADGTWRFNPRHRLDASWFDLDLHGHKALSADITFGGQDYTVGTDLESRFRTTVYKLSYGYTFLSPGRHEFTGLLGFHVIGFEARLSAANLGRSEDYTATAPLPVVGLAWRAHWTPCFSTEASVQYFGISLDDGRASGHLTDIVVAAQYRLGRRFGLGGGYNRFALGGEFSKGPLTFTLDHHYDGLLAYLFVEF